MAWSYRSKRTYSRSARRSFRRRRLARPRYRRSYRRGRRYRKTSSAVVKLTVEVTYQASGPIYDGQPSYLPFVFTPLDLPGFAEYQLTYSQFRILKCKFQVSLNPNRAESIANNNNFLVAPSRPFARNMGPLPLGENTSNKYVPPAKETDLRQTRWQKIVYPSKVTSKLNVGFKPYTLVGTTGPSSLTNAQWTRVWECSRWMPFNWANTSEYDLNPSGATGSLVMYGPYLVPNTPAGGDPTASSIAGTLTVYLQFRGQR